MINDAEFTIAIGTLRKLKKLNLTNNKLKNGLKLSEALNGAKNLKVLKLSNN